MLFKPPYSRPGPRPRSRPPLPLRIKRKPAKGRAAKEENIVQLLDDMKQRLPTEIRWMVYQHLDLPARIVTLFLSSTTLRRAFGHEDHITEIPSDADCSPIPPSPRDGVCDLDYTLATRNGKTLSSIGRTWFPVDLPTTEQILDHPIRGAKLLAQPLHGVCDVDCPAGYEFLFNSGIHGISHPRQREHFDFERDTLYLRLSEPSSATSTSTSTPTSTSASASASPATELLDAMEALRPAHASRWPRVRNLALRWKDPPSRYVVHKHIGRVQACFPNLRQLVVVRKHYQGGESEVDGVFASPGALERVWFPPRASRRRLELLDLGRDLGGGGGGGGRYGYGYGYGYGFAEMRYDVYCDYACRARPAWRDGDPLIDVVVKDIVPEKIKREADESKEDWLCRAGVSESMSLWRQYGF
ncbi:hypothetical protein Hte_004428 [Hypoxylon texense]